MDSKAQSFDLVIAGGGLVGATFACLLDGLDLRIALADRNVADGSESASPSGGLRFDARVSALNEASRRVLRKIGVWAEVQAIRCCDYREMRVWDAEGTGSIHFSAKAQGVDSLGTIVENSIVLARLHERLHRQDNVTVVSPFVSAALEAATNGETVLVDDQGRRLQAGLLVAADGGNSAVRRLAGIASREWDYGQAALVTTVRTSAGHGHTAWQRFLDTGPLALLPLAAAADTEFRHGSIVWSTSPEQAEQLLEMPDERFRHHLATALEHRLGAVEWSDRRFQFPLRQRHAHHYAKGGIVLIGDAAHTIHPLAGQGVNLGIADAAALAGELRCGLAAGRRLSDPLLPRRYARSRRGANLRMIWAMEGLHRLFGARSLPLRWLRNTGLDAVDRAVPIKNYLARHAMGA